MAADPPGAARPLRAPYAPPDDEIAAQLLAAAPRTAAAEAAIDARASRLIEGVGHAGILSAW